MFGLPAVVKGPIVKNRLTDRKEQEMDSFSDNGAQAVQIAQAPPKKRYRKGVADKVLAAVKNKPGVQVVSSDVEGWTGLSRGQVNGALASLAVKGVLRRVRVGRYVYDGPPKVTEPNGQVFVRGDVIEVVGFADGQAIARDEGDNLYTLSPLKT